MSEELATPIWFEYSDPVSLAEVLAPSLAESLERAINERGQATLAVSGGSTPGPLFDRLSTVRSLDWSRVTVGLVDERYSADLVVRNETLVLERLLVDAARSARFIAAFDGARTLEQRVADFESGAAGGLAFPPARSFDVCVLGMGLDGHTASLFPGAEGVERWLDPEDPASWAAVQPESAPHARLTMTLSAIVGSGRLVLHITGNQKRDVLEQAVAGQRQPIGAVAHAAIASGRRFEIWWSP